MASTKVTDKRQRQNMGLRAGLESHKHFKTNHLEQNNAKQ
jgi:hypothetical protein